MAKKQKSEYEALAAQIGHLGAVEEETQQVINTSSQFGSDTPEMPSVKESEPEKNEEGLGRLSRPELYGGHSVTDEEQERMDRFDQEFEMKSKISKMNRGEYEEEDPLIAEGWVPIDRKEFGIRGQFYSPDWQFYIRPATTMAIKNWISVDEENALQLNNVFDEIIKLCVKIKSPLGNVSWSKINAWDRFWLILKVRELTFTTSSKSITFEDACAECDTDITFALTPDALHYEFPDEDIVEKHWDPATMAWRIDPEEYGVYDEEMLVLHTPTLAVQNAIIEYAQRAYTRKKKTDEQFLSNFLPWLLTRVVKDDAQMDKQIQKIEKAYKNWSVEYHSLMTDIVRNITINPKETLKTTCPHCGEEVVSNVQFPNGVKVLFTVETGVRKFGTR